MGREFTGESAFVDAYSEYFDAVYREATQILWKPSRSRRNCAGCLLHGICTEWK